MRKRLVMLLLVAAAAVASTGFAVGGEMRGAINGKAGAGAKAADVFMATGTVVFIDLEGGFWGIMADDGHRYDPGKLANDFRKEGLRVQMQGRVRTGAVSLRMWGQPIEVLSIKRLDGGALPPAAR